MATMPIERTWPLKVVAERLEVAPSTLRSILSRHKDLFPVARLRKLRGHPRRHRVLTAHELYLLEAILLETSSRSRVKKKFLST